MSSKIIRLDERRSVRELQDIRMELANLANGVGDSDRREALFREYASALERLKTAGRGGAC